MHIEITKLIPAHAEDYIHFFDTTPHDDYNPENTCYCVSWCSADHRLMTNYPSRKERKQMAIEYIRSGKIQGYLAYMNGQVVGWCNANTKAECINCGGWLYSMSEIRVNPNEKVKSIYCFLVAPEMKRKGIAKQLLQFVCQDALACGFDYVEAYPQKENTDERMFFMGFVNMYQDLGFYIHAETKDKFVMRKQLK
ncbi:MAG: GNAT family N-acetyltransferase [Clostridia bacterium]|nr:GNAT family N-acetyltransferase [Clostridia bacterium]